MSTSTSIESDPPPIVGINGTSTTSPEAGPSNPASNAKINNDTTFSSLIPDSSDGDGDGDGDGTPRSSSEIQVSPRDRIAQLENELASTQQEKETLGNQYRGLLGKLTAMRTTLGDKLREDAEELDRRETTINHLSNEIASLQSTIQTLQSELSSASQESASLQAQLAQLRSQSDSSSSDVLSLTREMRELRGEMERLRLEREEWEVEAGRERERREAVEEEMRLIERRERDERRELERALDELDGERERGNNLQEVLSEFQVAKDSELRQATTELETQLRLAATSLSEYKLRAANAETRLSEVSSDATRSSALERELREKNQLIGKLRHDAVVNNEHLTEALRRLRKNSSDNNVDRRLVTNILLSFLTTARSDSKRFEMLSLLSTILSWDDNEREKAGLQRQGATGGPAGKSGSDHGLRRGGGKDKERSAEEEAAMNESFSNLFVEFLLKEASQGQSTRPNSSDPHRTISQTSLNSPGPFSPPPGSLPSFSPTGTSGMNTPYSRPRGMSSSSNLSESGRPGMMGGRKASYGLRDVMGGGGHQ
ncbi:hypothetical protein IAR55_000830 [Kwoniella newhampshirensis]|uniref:GRIP domain-containing protein n=1 Tax=Kwoniella newhampshirensis TaxID=1651941 RepID=A0AAW0Z442_9TREE